MAEDDTIKLVRRQVDAALSAWGTYFSELEPGRWRAVQGSAEVQVSVGTDPDGTVMVRVRAPVAYEARLDEEALRLLLEVNDALPIAAFSVGADGRISVGQCLHGELLQEEELRRTVRAVALAANGVDELIAERTGGLRSVDARPWLK